MQVLDEHIFLSTPSARRATLRFGVSLKIGLISIHALREEGDVGSIYRPSSLLEFLSTPSARRATHGHATAARHLDISIHALREEGDRAPGQ